jgi:hypothetical protein
MSSNGDPGGNVKGNGLLFVTTVWVVEMFTTEGINLSAKSAKDSGTDCEYEYTEKLKLKNIDKNKSLIFFILALNKINNYKSYNRKN